LRVGDQGATAVGRFNVTGETLELSEDGRVLAVRAGWIDGARMVRTLSLETFTLLHTWGREDAIGPSGGMPDADFVLDFSMARRADRVAVSFVTQTSFIGDREFHVFLDDTRGEHPIEVPGGGPSLRLSPTGAHLLTQTR